MAGFPATVGWDNHLFSCCTDPLAFGRSPRSSEECWVPRWTASVKNRCGLKVFHTYTMRHACYLSLMVVACVLVGTFGRFFEIGEKSASELQESDLAQGLFQRKIHRWEQVICIKLVFLHGVDVLFPAMAPDHIFQVISIAVRSLVFFWMS